MARLLGVVHMNPEIDLFSWKQDEVGYNTLEDVITLQSYPFLNIFQIMSSILFDHFSRIVG